jgi:hypothetical protein
MGAPRGRQFARCAALLAAWATSPAWAHPDVDEARRLFEAAEFAGARSALDRAEQSRALTRADVIELLEARVLVHYALGDARACTAALDRLAALEPQHRFPSGTNPDVVDQFAAIRTRRGAAMALDIEARATPHALVLEARPLRDVAGLTKRTTLHVRRDDGAWQAHAGPVHRVPLLPEGPWVVAYRGDLVGAGGATLVSTAVEVWQRPAAPQAEERPSRARWYWGAAAAVVLAAGVTAAIVLTRPESSARPSAPVVDWR